MSKEDFFAVPLEFRLNNIKRITLRNDEKIIKTIRYNMYSTILVLNVLLICFILYYLDVQNKWWRLRCNCKRLLRGSCPVHDARIHLVFYLQKHHKKSSNK